MDNFVAEKLREWGLIHLTDTFIQNRVDTEAFNCLTENMIRDLIVPVGDRSIFSKYFAAYSQELVSNMELVFVGVDNLDEKETGSNSQLSNDTTDDFKDVLFQTDESIPSDTTASLINESSSAVAVQRTSHVLRVESLLNSDIRGQQVLHLYKKSKILDYSNLSAVLIDKTLLPDPNVRIPRELFLSWSKGCIELFPGETLDTFYNKTKNNTGGILYDKYLNKRRILKDLGMLTSKKVKTSGDEIIDLEEDVEEMLTYLQNHMEPITDLIPKCEKTVTARGLEGKNFSIDTYFNKYKGLKRPNGYVLIEIDFKFLHEKHVNKFFEKWPGLAVDLIHVARNRIKNFKGKESAKEKSDIEEFLRKYDDVIKSGKVEVVSLLLLPLLLRTASFKTHDGTIWRLSIFEVQRGFIVYALTNDEVQPILEARQETIESLKLTNQPLPIIIRQMNDILNAKVKINDTEYELPSALKAVDVCYKSFFALNATYPVESKHIWSFLQRHVYEMTDSETKKFTAVNKLITALKNINNSSINSE